MSDNSPKPTEIEITPAMIEAALAVIRPLLWEDGSMMGIGLRQSVEDILHAALQARPQPFEQ